MRVLFERSQYRWPEAAAADAVETAAALFRSRLPAQLLRHSLHSGRDAGSLPPDAPTQANFPPGASYTPPGTQFQRNILMRLLQLVESAACGVGRHVMALTEGLLVRDHEVHLVYSEARCDRVFTEALLSLGTYPGFHVSRVHMQREPRRSDLHAVRSLRQYLGQHGPFDVVHC